jgi:hypothetical protein
MGKADIIWVRNFFLLLSQSGQLLHVIIAKIVEY